MKSLVALVGSSALAFFFLLIQFITFRVFMESRYVPSTAMLPTVRVGDRLLVEKVSGILGRQYKRGEIVVFYPPPIEMNGHDLSWDLPHIMGRLTGFPFLPYEPAFIKRVIGLPGEHIAVVAGRGVYVNGERLEEQSYVSDLPNYTLKTFADMGGVDPKGSAIDPYKGSPERDREIVVPPHQLFVLGDNRQHTEDSHIFGMLDQNRVIGRAQLRFYPTFETFKPPAYASKL